MKLNRVLWVMILAGLTGLAGLSATAAKADGLPPGDPFLGAFGDPPPPNNEAPEPITSSTFTIQCMNGNCPVEDPSPSSPCVLNPGDETSPSCYFENDFAVDGVPQVIDELIFDINATGVTCDVTPLPESFDSGIAGPPVFGGCVTMSDGGSGTDVIFSGGTGITFHEDILLDYEGFPADTVSSVTANVPEPGTLPMLGIGLVVLLGLIRKRVFQHAE